jgi:phosphohistidine phosphatase
MKYLTLLRHGKSDWSMPFRTDYERPLKARGRRDVPRMGEYLASLDLLPDLIVSSPAERARQTAELFAEAVGYDGPIAWDEAIYAASAGELMSVLRRLPATAEHVLLVGHNPGFEDLADRLIGADLYGPAETTRLPTAAAAHIQLEVDGWREVQLGCGQLQWLMTPKTLREAGY